MAEECFAQEGYEESRRLIENAIRLEEKEPEAAETLYSESLRVCPSSLGFYPLGKLYFRKGNYAEARVHLEKASEFFFHGDTLFQLAKTCAALNDFSSAKSHLEALLRETPDHPSAKSWWFWVKVRQRDIVTDLDSLTLEPSKVNKLICEALCQGQVSAAQALAQEAMDSRLNPSTRTDSSPYLGKSQS